MFQQIIKFREGDINPLIDIKDMDYERMSGSDIIPKGAQPVDQFDSQPFMMAQNGFRRSDIAILMSAESEQLKQAISARIQDIKVSFPDQDLSDADLAAMAIPRHCQSQSAFRDWSASLEKGGFAKAVDDYIAKNKPAEEPKNTISFADSNSD